MLMLSPTAVAAVRLITSSEGSPQGAGLRIFTAPEAQTLQLEVAEEPADQDQVLTAEGTRVFLDHDAATLLDDKILDAQTDPNGNEAFVVLPQPKQPPAE
ncbi:MAG: hypothetical protein J2P18_04750 [Nocardia sp.]|nr:hypothetical protein [Nocardia sp.]